MSERYAEARRLFELFLDEEKTPNPNVYLEQCPPDQRSTLLRAFSMLNRVMNFYKHVPEVKPEESERLLKRIATLRRQEELEERSRSSGQTLTEILLEDAKVRISASRTWLQNDPVACLADALNLDALNRKVGVFQRATTRRGVPDETWLRSQEERIRSVADDLLRAAVSPGVPTDLDAVARHINVLVEKVILDASARVQGLFVTDGKVGGIVVNTNPDLGNALRQRFTFAHEIGHALLHKQSGAAAYGDGAEELRNYTDQVEQEANIFAANLLMPTSLVQSIYPSHEKPSFDHVERIARASQVSAQAALNRVIRASDYPCAFVMLQNGRVAWWIRSPYFEGNVEIGMNAPVGSVAREQAIASADRIQPAVRLSRYPASWVIGVESFNAVDEESYKISKDYIYTIIVLHDNMA